LSNFHTFGFRETSPISPIGMKQRCYCCN